MKNQKRWAVLLLSLSLGCGALFFGMNGKLSHLRELEQQNNGTISELESAIKEQKQLANKTPDVTLSDEEQKTVLSAATELGKNVASYQNAYASLNPTKDADAFQANVEAMSACLGSEDQKARVPWYATGGIAGTWEFVSDAEFQKDQAHVLWLCRSQSGELLAYATAVYQEAENCFTDVSYQLSMLANRNMESSGTGETKSITLEGLGDTIDKIKDADVGEVREQTDEELNEVKDAQEALRKSMTEGKGK